ncbi:OLC1v1024408C1 [Oldenlandia corymbosa var. corymbosa]|uniref:OLC1v1024408C1 n=1 Tax=Oldenlandia corymbosa var. corymbosa TaxID=529605 RepID=A0AAV1C2E4_OLDCO|nr:OLC1v1024408C1 [Oldenlandia corymbosa var. corymbosa]
MSHHSSGNGENHPPQQQPSPPPPTAAEQQPGDQDPAKWGTHIMGQPASPNSHPDNQRAASWRAEDQQQRFNQQHPYVVFSPVEKPSDSPFESVVHMFNNWSNRAETVARNIWHNLSTGPSVSGAAWGKLNLTAKALTEGGFESLFRQIFATDPNERLKKTFACYLSTTTGPVAGTLYLSTVRVGFCSDRPLSFRAPSGQETWSYYKVSVPLANIANVNPVVMKDNPPEKYIQLVTVDGHDFWFTGFVNFEKASHHLLESVSNSRAHGNASQRTVAGS